MPSASQSGARAEQRAAAFLQQRGFQILTQNIRTPFGEIDLVCREGSTLVFVEVRYRASATFGAPEETVVGKKFERMRQSAEWYVQQCSHSGAYRIDVVGISGAEQTTTHLRNVEA